MHREKRVTKTVDVNDKSRIDAVVSGCILHMSIDSNFLS
jgi:hypothetical protein